MKPGTNHPGSGRFAPIGTANWGTGRWPLGARRTENGDETSFAVFSRHATRILLEIYDYPLAAAPRCDYWMAKNPDDDVWRARLAGVPEGTLYGFRCWGPNWPYDEAWERGGSDAGFVADVDGHGNRFNPNKALFDPYARELTHDMVPPEAEAAGHTLKMYNTGPADYGGAPGRVFDTGRWVPKGVVVADHLYPGRRPLLPPEKAIIYEAHLKGLTMHPSASRLRDILGGLECFAEVESVPDAMRGTYAGAAHMAKYLKGLGYTTIELLPVHETITACDPDLEICGNYWGYMTVGYFAPNRRYAFDTSPGGPTREFKAMVEAFHREGIEVYLDVVFNHTGEGGTWNDDPAVTSFACFGGFDAASYYMRTNDNLLVDGATGCGNQLNFSEPACGVLVLDSLTYWIEVMGIDGFRFDLAPVLGRKPAEFGREHWEAQRRFFSEHPLLLAIAELGKAEQVEMIAEAWDIWGYEVGNFPQGWGEWNGRFRDAVRDFVRGGGDAGAVAGFLNGDYEHFSDQGGPQHSINFVVAHDGFTLADLVSYESKTNLALEWPFGPSDGGTDDNRAWDCGGDPVLRRQQIRNFTTLLFFSRGVPMTVWGDEFGRTQNGNNNPYNIDSVATWNNYAMIATNRPHAVPTEDGGAYDDNLGAADCDEDFNPLFVFAAYLGRLRRRSVALQQAQYADHVLNSGDDVTYLFSREDAESPLRPDNRCMMMHVDGSEVGDHDFLLLINMYGEAVRFVVPLPVAGYRWVRIVDTAAWAEPLANCWPLDRAETIADDYGVNPHSIVVLQEVPE